MRWAQRTWRSLSTAPGTLLQLRRCAHIPDARASRPCIVHPPLQELSFSKYSSTEVHDKMSFTPLLPGPATAEAAHVAGPVPPHPTSSVQGLCCSCAGVREAHNYNDEASGVCSAGRPTSAAGLLVQAFMLATEHDSAQVGLATRLHVAQQLLTPRAAHSGGLPEGG